MIDLTKGMVTSHLTAEELEKYRAIPPPKKYRDIWTTAPRGDNRGTVLSTTKSYLSRRESRVRK